MKNLLLVLLLSSSLGAAQVSVPLTVKGHTIGESVPEFAAVIGIDYAKCKAIVQLSEKQARHQKSPWNFCKNLLAAEGSARVALDGWFDTQKLPLSLALRANSNVDIAPGDQIVLDQRAAMTQWHALFEAGQLAEFRVELDPKYSYADVLSELSTKYGKPTTENSVTLENAYGAQVKAGEAFWHLPSGFIAEIETVLPPSAYVGWERIVRVGYYSKARSEAVTRSMGKGAALD